MDLIILLFLIVFTTIGFFRGFFKEILGLISFIFAISLSIALNKLIVKKMLFMVDEPLIASSVAYVLSFLIILFLLMILNFIIIKIFDLNKSSIFNKIFGGLIGILKAYLICLLIYFIVYSFILVSNNNSTEKENTIEKMKKTMPKFFTSSKTFPIFIQSIDKIDQIIKILFEKKNEKIIKEKDILLDNQDTLNKEQKTLEENNLKKKELTQEEKALMEEVQKNNEIVKQSDQDPEINNQNLGILKPEDQIENSQTKDEEPVETL